MILRNYILIDSMEATDAKLEKRISIENKSKTIGNKTACWIGSLPPFNAILEKLDDLITANMVLVVYSDLESQTNYYDV